MNDQRVAGASWKLQREGRGGGDYAGDGLELVEADSSLAIYREVELEVCVTIEHGYVITMTLGLVDVFGLNDVAAWRYAVKRKECITIESQGSTRGDGFA